MVRIYYIKFILRVYVSAIQVCVCGGQRLMLGAVLNSIV